jgi:hypothetical protein
MRVDAAASAGTVTRMSEPRMVRMSDAEYFAQPAVNASTLKSLTSRAPAEVRWQLDHQDDHSSAFDLGSAVHALSLGTGSEIVVCPGSTWAGKDAKTARAEAYARGAVPLLAADFDAAQAMAESVRALAAEHGLFVEGQPEVVMLWSEYLDGEEIPCKAKADWLSDQIIDVKTTSADLDDDGLSRAIAQYKYHLQNAWYSRGYEALTGARPEFRFLFVHKKPPHLARIVRLADEDVDKGWWLAERGLITWQQCQRSGTWPGYPQDEILTLPRWAK